MVAQIALHMQEMACVTTLEQISNRTTAMWATSESTWMCIHWLRKQPWTIISFVAVGDCKTCLGAISMVWCKLVAQPPTPDVPDRHSAHWLLANSKGVFILATQTRKQKKVSVRDREAISAVICLGLVSAHWNLAFLLICSSSGNKSNQSPEFYFLIWKPFANWINLVTGCSIDYCTDGWLQSNQPWTSLGNATVPVLVKTHLKKVRGLIILFS